MFSAILGLGFAEILVILIIGMVLWRHRLPDMARWLGKSLVSVRKEANNISEDIRHNSR